MFLKRLFRNFTVIHSVYYFFFTHPWNLVLTFPPTCPSATYTYAHTYLVCTTKLYIPHSLNDSTHLLHVCSELRNYQFPSAYPPCFTNIVFTQTYVWAFSFGLKFPPYTQRPELWTTSILNSQQLQDLLGQQNIMSSLIVYVSLWFALQTVLSEKTTSFRKLSRDPQKDIVARRYNPVLGFKMNPQIPLIFWDI